MGSSVEFYALTRHAGAETGRATTCTPDYTHRTDRWIYPLDLTVLPVKAVMIYMHVTTNSRKKSA